jgi:putative hydrolase of the HAD superfamily
MDDFYSQYSGQLNMELEDFKQRWIALYDQYWPQYELGTLSLKEQRILRMQGLFEGRDLSTIQAEKYARFHNDSYLSHWRLFPDALPLLDHLRDRRLGVISNGNVERQRAKLERSGILDRFEVVVISADYGFAKPDPRIFKKACELARDHPHHSVHIGDHLTADVSGALGAGLSAYWINRTEAVTSSDVNEIKLLSDLINKL